uniref:Triadin n=1 Tax=Xenopus tropicalis TaxID=8364 RepID=A0A803KAP4_XENTR
MTENSVEGRTSSTITTVLEGKNGSIHKPSAQVKSVSHDFKTTFKSPVAWLLVGALIVTWSAVIIVVFDLVDYRSLGDTITQYCDDPCLPPGPHQPADGKVLMEAESFLGSSLNKFRSNPVGIIHEAVDETTDWIYGIYITISDLISLDEERKGHAEPPVKKIGGIQPALHRKAIPKLKAEEEDEPVKKTRAKEKAETKEKVEKKILPKASLKAEKKEKPEKITLTKSEKKEKSAIKPEKKDKTEKEASVKTEKKVKAAKLDKVKIDKKEKAEKLVTPKSEKKEKTEKVTPSKLEKKVKAEQIAPTKLEKKEKTEKVATTKSEKKEKAEKLTPVKVEKTLKLEKVAPVKAEKKEKAEKVVPVKVQKKEKAEKVVPVKDEKKEKAEKKQKAEKVVPVKDEKKDKAEKKQKAEKVVPVKAEKKGKAEKVAPVKPQKEKAEKVTSVKAEKKEKAEKIAPVKAEKKEKVEKIATSKAEKKVEKLAPVKPEKKEKAKKVAPVKSEKKEKTEKLTQDTTEKVKAEKVAPTKLEKKQKAETRAPVKTEKKDKAEKEIIPQEDKKVKVSQVEEKTKDVKAKTSERKVAKDSKKDAKEEEEIKTKPHTKVETLDAAETMGEIKDQYNFCRYVVDLYSHGDASTEEKSKEKPQEKKEVLPQEKPGELKISLPEKKDIPETKETVLEEVTIHEAEDECPKEDYEQVTPQATEKEPPKVMQDHLTAHKDTEESPKKEQEPMTPQIVKDGPPKPVEAEVKTEEKKEGRSQQPAFTGVSTDFGIMPRLIIIMSDSHGRFASRPDVSVDWTKREMLLKKEEKEAEPITQEKMDYIKEAPTTYIIAEAPVQINVTKPPDAKKEIQMEMPVRKLEEGPKEIKTEIPVEIPEEKTKDVKEEIPVEMPVKKLKEPEEIPVEIPVEKPKEVSKAKEQEVPLKKPEPKPAEVKKEVPLKKPEPKPAEVKKEEPVKKAEPEVKDIKKEVPLKKSEPKPAEVKKDELKTPKAIYEEKTTDKKEDEKHKKEKKADLKETEKKLKTEGKDPLHFFQWVTDEVLSSLNEYGILKFFNTTFLLNTANAVWTFEMPISIEFPTLGEADPLHFFHWAYEKMYSSLNEYAIIPFFNTTSNLLKASQSLWTMEIPMSISYFSLESIDPFRFFHWINEEVQRGLNEYGILSFFNTTSFLNTSCALWTFDMPISFPSFTDTFGFFHWVYEEVLGGLNRYGILNVFNTTTHALWNFEIPFSISFPTLEFTDPLHFFNWIYEETLNGLNNYGVLSLFNITSFWNATHALWDFEIPISITLPTLPSLESIDPLSFFHWIHESVKNGFNKFGIINFFNTTLWNATHGLWNFEMPISLPTLPTLESLDPLYFFEWVFEEIHNGLNKYGILHLFNTTSFWNATFWNFEMPDYKHFPTLESIDPRRFFCWVYEEVHNGLNKYGILNVFNITSFLNAAHDLWAFEIPISISFAWMESIDPIYFFYWVYEEVVRGLNDYGVNFFNTTFLLNATDALWNFTMPISFTFPTLEGTDPLQFFHWVYESLLSGLNEYGIINFFNNTLLNASHALWNFDMPFSISFPTMADIDPYYLFHWIFEEVNNCLDKYGIFSFFNTTSFWNATHALWNFEMPISFPTLEGKDPLGFIRWLYEELLNSLKEYGFPYLFDSTSDEKSPGYEAIEEETAEVHGQ